jgi:NTP pyrophosphatase (non-canonical NTP hydrolase)
MMLTALKEIHAKIAEVLPQLEELEEIQSAIVKAKAAQASLTYQVDSLKAQAKELRDTMDRDRHTLTANHEAEVSRVQRETQEVLEALEGAKRDLVAAQNDAARYRKLTDDLARKYNLMERKLA